MREVVLDSAGVARFKANAIVDWLFETGRINLNDIAIQRDKFPVEDVEEFWQMLGYSVSGYGDLSFAQPETVEQADEAVYRLLHPEDYTPGGMGNPIRG
jgi:hypothetical protein